MKLTLTIILSVIFIQLNAQNDSLGRVLFGGNIGGGITGRFASDKGANEDLKASYDTLETMKMGYAVGVDVGYIIKPNTWLISGLNFSNLGYKIDTLSESGIHDIEYNNYYIGLPVRLKYIKQAKTAVKPTFTGGVMVSYLISEQTNYKEIVGDRQKSFSVIDDLNRISVDGMIGVGIQADVVGNYFISADLMYRQAFTSISKGELNRFLNYTGLSFSIVKRI